MCPRLKQNASFEPKRIFHHVPDFDLEPKDTVPFRPNEDKLTLAVVAAFDTVALAGMIPHNMTTAKTADIILLAFFFTLLYLFSVFVRLLRPSSLRWSTFEFIHTVLLSLTTSPRLDILSKRL